MHIGEDCRTWRQSRGITQKEIASRAGVSKSLVCRFEKGEVDSNRLLSVYLCEGYPATFEGIVAYLGGGVTDGKEEKERVWSGENIC